MDMKDPNLIEKFLRGELSPEDHETFQQKLTEDPELERSVQETRNLFKLLEEKARQRFQKGVIEAIDQLTTSNFFEESDQDKESTSQLTQPEQKQLQHLGKKRFHTGMKIAQEELEAEGFFAEEKPSNMLRLWWTTAGIAASILFLVWAINWFGSSTQSLYRTNFSIDVRVVRLAVEEMGLVQINIDPLERALMEAEAKNYEAAKEEIEKLISLPEPELFARRYAKFLLAMIHMKEGNLDQARPLLNELANDQDFEERDVTHWFLGLIHLKANDKVLALDKWERIPAESYYYERAQRLIAKIDSK